MPPQSHLNASPLHFAVMAEYRPLWVVDLHEARVFEHL